MSDNIQEYLGTPSSYLGRFVNFLVPFSGIELSIIASTAGASYFSGFGDNLGNHNQVLNRAVIGGCVSSSIISLSNILNAVSNKKMIISCNDKKDSEGVLLCHYEKQGREIFLPVEADIRKVFPCKEISSETSLVYSSNYEKYFILPFSYLVTTINENRHEEFIPTFLVYVFSFFTLSLVMKYYNIGHDLYCDQNLVSNPVSCSGSSYEYRGLYVSDSVYECDILYSKGESA